MRTGPRAGSGSERGLASRTAGGKLKPTYLAMHWPPWPYGTHAPVTMKTSTPKLRLAPRVVINVYGSKYKEGWLDI